MKNIIIFAGTPAVAAEKIVSLFNEGNRIRTVCVVIDNEDEDLRQRLESYGSEVIVFDRNSENEMEDRLSAIIAGNDVKLILLDNWDYPISERIAAPIDYHVVYVTSQEKGPQEVVTALDSLDPSLKNITIDDEAVPQTPEEEWAEALKINFKKPKDVPPVIPPEELSENSETPPPLPEENSEQTEDFSQPQMNSGYADRQESGYSSASAYGQTMQRQNYAETFRQAYREERERERVEPMPPNYLIWSILFTIFCCFIPGIIAIIFSSQVSSKYYAGDIEGARRASKRAEIWIIVSFVLGVLSATVYLPISMLG